MLLKDFFFIRQTLYTKSWLKAAYLPCISRIQDKFMQLFLKQNGEVVKKNPHNFWNHVLDPPVTSYIALGKLLPFAEK